MSSDSSENESNSQNNSINVTGTQTTDYLYALFTNPSLLITLSIIVLIFYLLFSSLGNLTNSEGETSGQEKSGLAFIELLLWATFFLLIFINSAVYFFEFDITAGVNNLFSDEPQVDINVTTPYSDNLSSSDSNSTTDNNSSKPAEEVFHIPGNDYVYEDAKALCGAYGAR